MYEAEAKVFPVLSPWEDAFGHFADSIRHSALIVAPFITERPLQILTSKLQNRDLPEVVILTNLAADSLLQGSLNPKAIADFYGAFPKSTSVYHLPGLHAKAYVADEHTAIITSGNLTSSSLYQNIEYGIRINDVRVVKSIRNDFVTYKDLGAKVSAEGLLHLASLSTTLREKYSNVLGSAHANLKDELTNQLDAARTTLMELRGDHEASTNAIFMKSLVYILRNGPMQTKDIHPIMQSIHPDLWDDEKDRVINGIHFGREWKHRVRGAQVTLRRQGIIELTEGRWRLVGATKE